jgi:hypothetical protein
MKDHNAVSGDKPRIGKQRMTFHFPGIVEQVNDSTINLTVDVGEHPALSKELCQDIIMRLGERDGERFIEDQTDRINRELILRSVI